jgi:hypothetical protein
MAEALIPEEPADGTIVAWFRGRQPCLAMVRIDAFAEQDRPLARWYHVDEERGFDEGPNTWAYVCARLGTDDGPYPLTVGARLEVPDASS